MQSMKDQQNQLIVLQNLAKQQLYDLEKMRAAQAEKGIPNHHVNGIPNYETPEQVQDDVSSLMNRMKTLTNFIQNQSDLSSLMGGDDGEEILSEQMMLQKKLFDLKSKKQMMDSLVAELSSLNTNADTRFDDRETTPTPSRSVAIEYDRESMRQQTPTRNVPIEYQHRETGRGSHQTPTRNVPIEYQRDITRAPSTPTRNVPIEYQRDVSRAPSTPTRNVPIEYQRIVPIEMINNTQNRYATEGSEHHAPINENDEQISIATKDDSAFGDKIAEINAMKDQLKRLKHMMDTVKLIEMKTGEDEDDEEEEDDDDDRHDDHHVEHETAEPEHDENYISKSPNRNTMQLHNVDQSQNEQDDTQINQRVVELQSITQNLRQQALSLVAQRDLIRSTRDDLVTKTKDVVSHNEKKLNQSLTKGHAPHKSHLSSRQRSDLEKKKEYENLLKSIEKEVDNVASSTSTISSKRPETEYLYYPDQWSSQQPSSVNHDRDRPISTKVKVSPLPNNGAGKDSADSGAVDLMNIEAGSVQSGSIQSVSTRSLSLPPPMPTLADRTASEYTFFLY